MAELSSLTVSLNDAFSAGAKAVSDSADKMASAMDKAAASSETIDTAVRTRGQTFDSVQKKIDGVAASTAKLEQIEATYQARVQVTTAAMQAQGASATQISDAIVRLGVLRDQDAEKAVVSGQKTERQFRQVADAALAAQSAAAQAAKAAIISSPNFSFARDRGADIEAYGAQLDVLRAKFNPLFAVSKQYESLLNEIGAAEKVGAISANEAATARAAATDAFSKSNAPLSSAAASLDGIGVSSRNASTQMRLLGVQAIQTASGLATGQPVLTTLIQQGHQVADSLLATGTGFGALRGAFSSAVSAIGPLNIALLAGEAAITALGAAAEHESTRLGDLRQQLRATHDGYLALADSVDKAAKASAASSALSLADARSAAQTIGGAKYFAGTQDDIIALTKVSADLARVWNTDVGAAAKFVADALNDPAHAAKDLAEKGFPGMSAALAESISKMQAAGQGGQAFNAVLTVVRAGTVGATQDVSPLKQALHDLEQTFTGASAGGKSLATTLGDFVNKQAAYVVIGLNDVIRVLEKAGTAAVNALGATKQALQQSGFGYDPSTGTAIPGANSVTPSSSSGGNSLSQVDPGIRTLVEAAAKQNQLDTELLARLQLAENSKPLGKDLGGNPVFATSSTGNIGPMQVGPATFAGMQNLPYGTQFQGQVLGNNATNVNAGAAYFSYLLTKYGDVKIAVMAYQDGETRMDKVLNGGGRVSNSQEAIDEALKVTRGYTGTGRAQAASAGPAFPGEALTAQNAAVFVGASAGAVSSGIRNDTASVLKQAQEAAQGIGLIAESRDKLIAQQHLFEAALKIPDQTPAQLYTWQKALDRVKGELNDSLTPAQAYVRSLTDQLPAAVALTEGDRRLAEVQKALADQERSQPGSVTPEIRAQAIAAAVDLQSAAYKKQVFDIETNIQAQSKITDAYGQGYAAVAHVTAQTQAYNEAIKLFPRGSDQFKAALAGLTTEYERQAQASKNAQIAAATLGNKDQLEFLRAETTSLGQNDDARTAMLNHLKAEQELKKATVDKESELGRAYLSSVDAISSQTAAFKLQEASLNEIKGFFNNTFDTISTAITQAFATGNLAALKFKDIAKSVASAVISEFAKLAILNPLKNFLFGSNDVTLSGVGGVLGNLFGGGGGAGGIAAGTAVASTVSAGSAKLNLFGQPGTTLDGSGNLVQTGGTAIAAGVGGLGLTQGVGILTSIDKLFGTSLTKFFTGGESGGGIIATLGDKIVTGITDALGPGITQAATEIAANVSVDAAAAAGVAYPLGTGALQGVGSLARLGAGVALASGASSETATAVATAAQTVSDALPYIGAAISVVTNLINGNLRGAAFVATGGAIGAGIGGVIGGPPGAAVGAGIGALVGSIADLAFPAHPLHPFDATAVDVQDGQLAVGKSVHQVIANDSLESAQNFIKGVNTFMAKAGLILENGNGQLGAIGQGIAGMVGLVTDPAKLIAQLRFKNDPNDTSQFGAAKGALEGMSFADGQALQDELVKIAGFADATAAIGVKLQAVGTDLTNIQIASVSGANPSSRGTSDNGVQYLNDLRTALNSDLPQHVYANVQALDDEINKVNQFVSGTLPGLLHPIEQTTSSIVDQANKTMQAYQEAINQSLQYGLDNTAVLKDAEEQALLIVRKSGLQQLYANDVQLGDRLNIATNGGAQASAQQAQNNFYLQADQQRTALTKLWTDTYGDGIKANAVYLEDMAKLEVTLGAERVAAAKQAAMALEAVYRGVADTEDNVTARFYQITGRGLEGALLAQDVKARDETTAFVKTWTDAFGDAITQSADFQERLAQLQTVQSSEKQAIVTQYATQPDPIQAKLTTLADTVQSIIARSYAASGDQKDADLINFDIKARQERAAFEASFVDLYGPGITANENYQAQLTGLETVQGQERLAIVKKYGDAVTGATADQIKSAQGSVASLFGSLTDYLQKLQTGTNSPLSPTAQYDLAKSQFNAVAGAAAAGDATSASKLTSYADAFRSTSVAVYGSGAQAAADFSRIIDAIQSVVQAPTDALTNSFLALQIQQQTTTIVQAQQATTDAINALRREVQQQARAAA